MFDRVFERLTQRLVNLVTAVPEFLLGIVVFYLFYRAATLLGRKVAALIETRTGDATSGYVAGRLVRITLAVVGALIAATVAVPSFNFTTLVTTLGLTSVAIGFAFKDIFENLIAGLMLLLSRPFRIGDTVDTRNYRGIVLRVDSRVTQLDLMNGEIAVVPNRALYLEPLVVIPARGLRRLESSVRIDAGYDVAAAREAALSAIEAIPEVAKDPAPVVQLEFAVESFVFVRAQWWTDTSEHDFRDVSTKVVAAINQRLIDLGLRPKLVPSV